MKRFTAGAALLLAMSAMTGACAKHDEDTANLTTTNETVVTDETVTNGVDDNLSASDVDTNAGAGNTAAPGNGL